MKKIFILTGEASGDKLASEVILNLKKINPEIDYLSVGGENLKKLGVKSIYNLKEITYLGFTKVILNIFKIKKKIDETVKAINEFQPDILFTVDSPDFTLRVAEKVKKDNPKFKGKDNWLPEIYQIGVRNPQGMGLSPYNNKIYLTNHGARGGDWFGEAKHGENYGWKILGWGGTNYTGTKIGPKWKPGFSKAIKYWVPSIAASSMVIYKGEEFKEWNGDALITSLRDQSLRKIKFKDDKFINEQIIFKDKIGRIRDIEIQEKTGEIFLITDQGSVWRLSK